MQNPFQVNRWNPGYFQSGSNYGGSKYWEGDKPTDFWGGVRQGYLQSNPDAAYTIFTSPFVQGNSHFDQWVRNQYGQVNDAYKAALSYNPDLQFGQFLSDFGEGGFRQRFAHLAPEERGVRPGNYGGGRMQWFGF